MVELVEITPEEIRKTTPVPYEKVVRVTDDESGLLGFISVHDSTIGRAAGGLGIALGGLRMWPYATEQDAIEGLIDVNRLSAGMTYKSAVADNGCGGGKANIVADPKKYPLGSSQREKLMRAMGKAIEEFNRRFPDNKYVTAEDVGTSPADMKIIHQETEYVSGIGHGEFDGNPSPFTAAGVLVAMKETLGVETMKDKKVAISGVGHVGGVLATLLLDEGAILTIADLDAARCDRIKQHGQTLGSTVTVVTPAEIHKQDVDVYAPCALGACLNDETIPEIKAQYIIGAANNQLKEPRHGIMLRDAGKIYIPDFVTNAGGVIAVAMEVKHRKEGIELTRQQISDKVDATVRKNVKRTLEIAQEQNSPLSEAGMALANERLAAARTQLGTWVSRTEDRGESRNLG